jgi:hypothetical protein
MPACQSREAPGSWIPGTFAVHARRRASDNNGYLAMAVRAAPNTRRQLCVVSSTRIRTSASRIARAGSCACAGGRAQPRTVGRAVREAAGGRDVHGGQEAGRRHLLICERLEQQFAEPAIAHVLSDPELVVPHGSSGAPLPDAQARPESERATREQRGPGDLPHQRWLRSRRGCPPESVPVGGSEDEATRANVANGPTFRQHLSGRSSFCRFPGRERIRGGRRPI